MPERSRLHPNPEVNLRKFSRDERKVEKTGYVVKYGNGTRVYADTYKKAREIKAELVKNGHWPEHVHIVNISRQAESGRSKNSNIRAKRYLMPKNMDSRFMGSGLTGNELAHMVMGRMCEATSHTFQCSYATPEMRKMAQRALMHKVRDGRVMVDETVEKALKMKISTGKHKEK